MAPNPDDDSSLDLDDRRLCPDGSCIGVLGPDGRCKVCGRADDGSVIAPALAAADADGATVAEGESFDDDRELCPDGSCIGVLGPDGRCKVCGRTRGS